MKNKTTENKNIYTEYNALFEVLQKKSKKLIMQNALVTEHDIEKTWDTIKQVNGKTKYISNSIPKRMTIDSINTFYQNKIAICFQ